LENKVFCARLSVPAPSLTAGTSLLLTSILPAEPKLPLGLTQRDLTTSIVFLGKKLDNQPIH